MIIPWLWSIEDDNQVVRVYFTLLTSQATLCLSSASICNSMEVLSYKFWLKAGIFSIRKSMYGFFLEFVLQKIHYYTSFAIDEFLRMGKVALSQEEEEFYID